MFCFPISDHVMVSQRTVSFKCRPRVSTCICMHNFDKTKGKFPGEHQVVWTGKNKTYKLKRSIPWHRLTSGLLQLTVEQLSTINKGKDYKKASTWSKQIENFINVSEPYSFRKPHTNNPHHLISTPPPPPLWMMFLTLTQHNTTQYSYSPIPRSEASVSLVILNNSCPSMAFWRNVSQYSSSSNEISQLHTSSVLHVTSFFLLFSCDWQKKSNTHIECRKITGVPSSRYECGM